eukprot:CAMPEP_0181190532 /NCGR_PEP_ID=MMETSP1096-20121128/12245_1 /TAXON_ID=156174 ORGANISM="Chrysochromulina ericina, Strain CCMP281" /NCGR_SAMPLE_ID=MMETSP1096 /ASSEMBLY_ACC=CAM_ASM_000453 /LENGTH=103 /DNA_ID=CAMNT_0023279757 /DNA_START=310 /DNA_END=622 /DNA_ORIENTATION=+
MANILASQRHWAMVYNPTPARGLSQALVKTRRLQPQLSVSLGLIADSLRTSCGLIADPREEFMTVTRLHPNVIGDLALRGLRGSLHPQDVIVPQLVEGWRILQ